MWGWRRPTYKPPPPERGPAFDAVIDIAPDDCAGRPDEEARALVLAAVRSVPAAGRIRVRTGALVRGVRVFAAGTAREPGDPAWALLRGRVAAAVDAALPRQPRREGGLAEAPGQIEALAALAALAQSIRPAPPASPAAPDPGTDALAHLLAFVLPEGAHATTAHATAARAVQRFGSFAAVLAAPEPELRAVPGLGTHSIAAIKLVHEAALRLARGSLGDRPLLDDPARLRAYLTAAIARERIEQVRVLFLDGAGALKADEVLGTGTVNHTPVYPREVLRRALALEAASIVLVHNHPSGDPTPSQDDLLMTAEIARAATTLGIALHDHVIVGNGRVLSFREAGLLEPDG